MRVLRDVPYFTGPAADPNFHSLDLYLPEGKSNVPMMFFVHGGGWRAGDKSLARQETFVDLCLSQGMAVASVNYRLSPAVKHPAHIQGCSARLRMDAQETLLNTVWMPTISSSRDIRQEVT